MKKILPFLLLFVSWHATADNGHQLWLRSQTVRPVEVVCKGSSPTLRLAQEELHKGWQGKANSTLSLTLTTDQALQGDGFRLRTNAIEARTEAGLLYGVYELLRRQQTGQAVDEQVHNPSYQRRILNHWDNPDGTIERGYAGHSIFWRKGAEGGVVTAGDKQLWLAYARANASIGINGTVLNNVNASPDVLTAPTLARVKAIADLLRPYGIQTYLSVKFSSPSQIGGLKSNDPLDPKVIQWWQTKAKEIYRLIPDFGGFLVKANSEGQPGPQDYGRTHADGANMLADAVKPFGGIVMWRAFVYSATEEDRAKQAVTEFLPLDGTFRDNVIIQVKNGPIDFQPREPFSPLFGAMKKSNVMAELQITQEYLGQSVHLVYLSPMWEEFLQSDTYQEGAGSTVARCTDGSLFQPKHTAIAGVANIGLDPNWCGHPFAQSNWYAFGRLAWNNKLSSQQIADEWIRLTFGSSTSSSDPQAWERNFLQPVCRMMMESHEVAVNYMMPLGLHHIFAANEHYGPGPWWAPKGTRKDWTPPYYHQADTIGIGFDRTATGSNAVSQYHEPLSSRYADPKSCPEIYLLWFHHLPWDYQVQSGRTLWDELCTRYEAGLQDVRRFDKEWSTLQPYVDQEQFALVQRKLREQSANAQIWKDACLLYFQQFSRRPLPSTIAPPVYDLDTLMKMKM